MLAMRHTACPLTLLLAVISVAACAASPVKPPPSELSFTLTPEEADVVSRGLMELPMKVALPVWQKLKAQFDAQVKPPPRK